MQAHHLQHLPESKTVAGENFEKFHCMFMLFLYFLESIFFSPFLKMCKLTMGVVVLMYRNKS